MSEYHNDDMAYIVRYVMIWLLAERKYKDCHRLTNGSNKNVTDRLTDWFGGLTGNIFWNIQWYTCYF